MTLTEMQDYIKKTTTTTKDKEEAEEEEEEEGGGEGVEQMTAEDEKSDSDEEEVVSMETVAMVTRLGRRKGDSSGCCSDGEQDGKYTNCAPVTMATVRLFLSPSDLQVPSSKRQKPLNICHWTKTAKSVNSPNMVAVCS